MTDISKHPAWTVSESDLQAYCDGQLDASRRAMVEAHLAAHPEDAARLNDYHAQTMAMHVLYSQSELPENDALNRLTGQLDRKINRQRSRRRTYRMAAAVAGLVAVIGVGWSMQERFPKTEDPFLAFTRQATDAHMLFAGRLPEPTKAEASDKSTVVSWLSQRLTGIPLQAPDLSVHGYNLTMERVLPSADGPAAQLMYVHDKKGLPITLFIGKNQQTRPAAFTYVQNSDVSIFYWQDGPLSYSLAGRLDRQRLLELAEEVSSQVQSVPPLPQNFVWQPNHDGNKTASATTVAPDPIVKPEPAVSPAAGKAEPDQGAVQPALDKRPAATESRPDTAPAEPKKIPASATGAEPAAEKPAPPPATAPEQEQPKNT